jgi:hypothetical protein
MAADSGWPVGRASARQTYGYRAPPSGGLIGSHFASTSATNIDFFSTQCCDARSGPEIALAGASEHRAGLLRRKTDVSRRTRSPRGPPITAGRGPPEGKYHARQRDNIRRFLGFGMVDADEAVACAADRATFWTTGVLEAKKIAVIDVPVPLAMAGQARPHSLAATLAWFTPTSPGRKSYRSVRLKLLEPAEIDTLGVEAHGNQPDANQTNRGTLFKRSWTGLGAPIVQPGMSIALTVQRDPDQGAVIDAAQIAQWQGPGERGRAILARGTARAAALFADQFPAFPSPSCFGTRRS